MDPTDAKSLTEIVSEVKSMGAIGGGLAVLALVLWALKTFAPWFVALRKKPAEPEIPRRAVDPIDLLREDVLRADRHVKEGSAMIAAMASHDTEQHSLMVAEMRALVRSSDATAQVLQQLVIEIHDARETTGRIETAVAAIRTTA